MALGTVRGTRMPFNLPAAVPAEVTSSTRPSVWPRGWTIVESDTALEYRNTGTLNAPVWTLNVSASSTPATTSSLGVVELSDPPADAAHPKVLGTNAPILASASTHIAIVGNPHGTTAAQVGAALPADVDTVQDNLDLHIVTFDTHVADRVKHPTVRTDAERLALTGMQDEELVLVKDTGRFHWWDATNSEWDSAPAAPGASYLSLVDVPTSFPPSAHKLSHAIGGTDHVTPLSIGAAEATRSISTEEGELTGGGTLQSDLSLGLPDVGPGVLTVAYPSEMSIDTKGRITALTPGTRTGVAFGSSTEEGVVRTSSDPPVGESPVVLLESDYAPGITTARQIITAAPLAGGGDLSVDRTLSINAATESAHGSTRYATTAETIAGTLNTRAVTPAGLAAAGGGGGGGSMVSTGMFSAAQTVQQTGIANNTSTKVLLDTEYVDFSGWFVPGSGGTGSRYTPLQAGWYDLRCAFRIDGSGTVIDGATLRLDIFKNGAFHRTVDVRYSSSGTSGHAPYAGGSCFVQANGTTDYFEMFITHTYGVTKSAISQSGTLIWFMGKLVVSL